MSCVRTTTGTLRLANEGLAQPARRRPHDQQRDARGLARTSPGLQSLRRARNRDDRPDWALHVLDELGAVLQHLAEANSHLVLVGPAGQALGLDDRHAAARAEREVAGRARR